MGHVRTENQKSSELPPLGLHEIFVLIELTLGHMRHPLTDVPLQQKLPT